MVILGLVSAGLVLVAVILMILRLSFDFRLTRIQREPDQSPLFRRKVTFLKRIEQARHIRYLLLAGLITGLATMIFLGSFLILTKDHEKMRTQVGELTERIDSLEKQQKQLAVSNPLRSYPEKGIGLKDYNWGKLDTSGKDSELQRQIELELAEKTSDYFGSFDTTASLAVPKALTLHLKRQSSDIASKETIKKNIDDFAKEAESIPELMEIHVHMITTIDKTNGKTKKEVYNANYAREKKEDSFSKKNVSEQNLKNDGGKG